jgi:hypothetical protein
MSNLNKSLVQSMENICTEDEDFIISEDKLLCKPCSAFINFNRSHGKQRVKEHVISKTHKKMKIESINKCSTGGILRESNQTSSKDFCTDLSGALISANTPFEKLNNPYFRNFLFKYTKNNIPEPSTLRKSYVNELYLKKVDKIREEIGDSDVYFIIDDTIDVMNRYVFNTLVRKLDGNLSNPMLLSTQFLETVDNLTISEAFLNACKILWPNGFKYDNVLLIVSDMATPMVKAMKNLKLHFRNLHHVTCLSHALHRVCEKVRENNVEADKFISSMKKILKKSPLRRALFHSICDCKLPLIQLQRGGEHG